ncbi:phage portal protein [Treponema pedis]|uniref:PBECR3 domain-containing polyvalent protein n=1 Tax=Treponema pedis TaxID=409322 RepID=UPI00040BF023|nr:phage portal protein [Treponema pedis]
MKEGFFYKAFTEAEHPRDENGRFTEKGKDVNTREIKYDRDYVLTRTGSKDFGEISPDIAKRIKRQAGKIRLRIGKEVVGEKDNYGQEHIARSGRMEQLKNNGYLNVRDFVEDIAGNFSAIYQGTGNSLILYKKDRAGASIFIQLEHTDDDFYDVKTGMITRESYIKNKKLLWSKTESSLKKEPSEVRTPHTKQYPSAHSSGSSNDIIIPQSDEKSSINKDFFYKAFTEAEHPRDEKGRFTDKGEAPKKWYEKPPATKEEIIEFATRALDKNVNERLFIGYINKETQKRIKEITGLEAKTIILDSNSVRHALNKETHNITIEDLQYMKEVIDTFSSIKLSDRKHYHNSVIEFQKDIDGEITFVEELRANRGQLELVTCYRKKKKSSAGDSMLRKNTPPETFVRNGSGSRTFPPVNASMLRKNTPPETNAQKRNDVQDTTIISQSDEKSSINKELQKTLNKLNEVFLPRIKIMEAYMGKKNRLNTITVSEVLKSADVQGVFDFEQSHVAKALVPAQGRNIQMNEGDIDIEKLLKKRAIRLKQESAFSSGRLGYSAESMARRSGLKSIFYDPLLLDSHQWGDVHTISPYYGRTISYRILRRVAEKAWILNLCVSNIIKKIRPFLKPVTEENTRGFRLKKKAVIGEKSSMSEAERRVVQELEHFMLHTGDIEDSQREDDLDKYVSKIIRDVCQLDQIAVELQRTRGGELCAFWAVDPATVEVALPLSEEATGIKYVQVINNVPYAYYTRDSFIFDCMNPRTDIERSGYGYSVVEQAIDLITSSINTFMYNAGFFTENKLPRGLLLLNGDADMDEIEDIEDYIVNLMSGPPTSQWRIPIIPAGKSASSDAGRRFEWVSLQGTNKEMEFQSWFDLQLSGIVGIFGFSMEDLGLHSQKSAPLIGNDVSPKMESSKSLILGDMLTFLQKHFNTILQYKNADYVFEFVGYERSDPRLSLDIDKEEVSGYKSLNEKRIEKGQKPLDFTKITNPADLPMNPQVIQAWQAVQQGSTSSGVVDDEEGTDDNAFDKNQDEESVDFEEGQEPEESEDGKTETSKEKNADRRLEWDSLSKSINQAVKIVI